MKRMLVLYSELVYISNVAHDEAESGYGQTGRIVGTRMKISDVHDHIFRHIH